MIAIIEGCGTNIYSIRNAFARLGIESVLTADVETIRRASHVILPGVGNATTAMQRLNSTGLTDVIRQCEQPVLGICLGMQILFSESCEGDVACLNILPGKILPLENHANLISPHMGWNQVHTLENSTLFAEIPADSDFYFCHGYYAPLSNNTIASTEYGIEISAAVQIRNFIGVQFHPEKSGKFGAKVLENFVRNSR